MAHLIPLIIFCLLLYFGRRKAKRIARPPESRREEAWIETVERLADPADALRIIEEIATGEIVRHESVTVTGVRAPSVPARRRPKPVAAPRPAHKHMPANRTHARHQPQYLLDGVDTPNGRVDRVARLQRRMGGRGLCSPR